MSFFQYICMHLSISYITHLVTTISFSRSEYMVMENETTLRVEIIRSGNISREDVVLIANQPYRGSAKGMIILQLINSSLVIVNSLYYRKQRLWCHY